MNEKKEEKEFQLDLVPDIHSPAFWELRMHFEEDAERMGRHCPIKDCGDVGCGVTGLANYLNQVYWIGFNEGSRKEKMSSGGTYTMA